MKFVKNKLFIILLIAFLVRVVLIIFTSPSLYEHNDSYLQRDWGRISFLYGFADTYNKEHISDVGSVNNLPPGATYIFGTSYYIHMQASKGINAILQRPPGTLLWMNDGSFANMFLRLPPAIADVIIGLFIYLLIIKAKKKNALFIASLYLFNPISIYNSAVWGQVDSVPTMFFVGALYFLTNKKYLLSMLAASLSLFVKLSLLPLFPLYAVILLFHIKTKKLIINSLFTLGAMMLFLLPISKSPFTWLIQFLSKNSMNVLDNVTTNTYNFWWIILRPKLFIPTIPATDTFIFASYNFWGYLLYGLFLLPLVIIIYNQRKKQLSSLAIFGAFSALSIIYFLFLPSMHERYLFAFFPLMAVYVGLKTKYLRMFLIVNIVYGINLFSVWRYMIPEATLRADPILTNVWLSWILSILITVMGVFIYTRFVFPYFQSQKKKS
ncbi:hypothetical protein COY16_03210 [Candidatus Roizmanbacteria bacterium CG_4_10_14_0_2_um_filter_39_13]|uniref:Glycosyltransferase RgtA/B/C/D-like domain-containing protein n=1 Tax=Candidatus Roizmanbacteria bacterium CG_4_10_14_0_2_um_filter_39_13 TaxID=1974825 RepID=A0A2M7TYN0_9BACT|nr:MAG: hypothetical protein COY16_03210 [Candidatus Roizmanbacteria bacterium CG_4_10_14_0_2_um_filter_39_13]